MGSNVSSVGYTDDQIHKTKNYFLLLFFLSSQTVLSKLFLKKPKKAILFISKNPKHFAEKEKSAVLVFSNL